MGIQGLVLLQAVALFSVLLTLIIILGANPDRSHSTRMLGVFLMTIAVSLFVTISFYVDVYEVAPWAFKLLLPVTLLIYPIAYLYMRSVLGGELKARKWDWLLYLPAVIYFISLIPFYTMPLADKRQLIQAYTLDPTLRARFDEGPWPAYFFPAFRVAWCLAFAVLNTGLLRSAYRSGSEASLQANKDLLRFLRMFNAFLWGLVLLAIYTVFANILAHTNLNLLEICLSLFGLMICLHLFFTPRVLYGYSHVADPSGAWRPNLGSKGVLKDDRAQSVPPVHPEPVRVLPEEVAPDDSVLLSRPERERYKQRIEQLFEERRPYLQPDYALARMVEDTGMPRYLLSAIINQEFGTGFREFLNRYRVEYFLAHIDSPEWQHLTLEAIAGQCGFVSRSTFINNFKSVTGLTPSEYVKSRNK